MIMRIEALLLVGLCFLGSFAPAFAQESEGSSGSAAAAIAATMSVDVDAVIAKHNEGLDAPRTFTQEERGWIAAGRSKMTFSPSI